MQAALSAALIVVGLGQAVAGYVFVIDGVLIGAGDGRWLAWGQVISLVLYIPIVLALRSQTERLRRRRHRRALARVHLLDGDPRGRARLARPPGHVDGHRRLMTRPSGRSPFLGKRAQAYT